MGGGTERGREGGRKRGREGEGAEGERDRGRDPWARRLCITSQCCSPVADLRSRVGSSASRSGPASSLISWATGHHGSAAVVASLSETHEMVACSPAGLVVACGVPAAGVTGMRRGSGGASLIDGTTESGAAGAQSIRACRAHLAQQFAHPNGGYHQLRPQAS